MKTTKDKATFLIELDRVLRHMYGYFHTADKESPLLFWILHNRDRAAYAPKSIPRKLPHLALYGKYKDKSIPRILAHTQWVEVEDLSYTNFILWLFHPSEFEIKSVALLTSHDTHTILVPLDLSLQHTSTHILVADWLK